MFNYKKNYEAIVEARISCLKHTLDQLAPMPTAASGSLKSRFNGQAMAGQVNPAMRDMPQRLGLERKLAYYRRKLRVIRTANLAASLQAQTQEQLALVAA